MNSFRMLMASSNPEYDRAFSAWLKKKCPPFETDLLDPQRWFEITEEDFGAYDRILLGGTLKHIHKGPGVRIADGFEPGESGRDGEEGRTDPYRPAEEVFRDLIADPRKGFDTPFHVRTMGFLLTEEDPALTAAVNNIIAALAGMGQRIIQADLRDIPSNEPAVFRREGNRTWDDFLYSCIYAQSPDLLSDPDQYASRNSVDVLRFSMSPGPNPYLTLTDSELRIMFGRLREYCPVDYFAAFLPEPDSPVFGPTLAQMELILILYRESESERDPLTETIRRIKEDTDPAKRILEVCISDRSEERDVPGFLLHLEKGSDSVPWLDSISGMPPEDLSALTEFIQNGCFI